MSAPPCASDDARMVWEVMLLHSNGAVWRKTLLYNTVAAMAGSMDDMRMLNLVRPAHCLSHVPVCQRCVTLLQVQQFLHERGYTAALEALTRESKHEMNIEGGGGQLCSILAEYEDMKLLEVSLEVLPAAAAPHVCGNASPRWMSRWLR